MRNQKIVIISNGKTVTAKFYENDKKFISTKAECHPDDKFDFVYGAQLAFERLTNKMNKFVPKYEVGDRVKIRENMIYGQYYTSPYGAGDYFIGDMCHAAGKTVKITRVKGEGAYEINNSKYNWIDTMFEGYSDKPLYYNGKVVCVEVASPISTLTKGKIYEFKDGYVTFDDGESSAVPVTDFNDLENSFASKFIEIKED